MEKVSIKAVLFDVDDTLYDRNTAQYITLDIIVRRLPEIFNGVDLGRITPAFIESDVITTREFEEGAPGEGLRDRRSRIFLNLLGLPEEYASTITELYVSEYPKVKAEVPGAVATVRELAKTFKIGIVSNSFTDVQYRKLETLGLLPELSCIVLSDEIGVRKPDPGIFTHATSLLELHPSACLYVGDSYTNDVIGAKKAGMLACWFNREKKKPGNLVMSHDFIIEKLVELIEICRRL